MHLHNLNSSDHRLSRRAVFVGITSSLVYSPALVRIASLMPVHGITMPLGRLYWELDHPGAPYPHEGFCRRLWFHMCEQYLKAGRASMFATDRRISEGEMRRIVFYARRYGFLK